MLRPSPLSSPRVKKTTALSSPRGCRLLSPPPPRALRIPLPPPPAAPWHGRPGLSGPVGARYAGQAHGAEWAARGPGRGDARSGGGRPGATHPPQAEKLDPAGGDARSGGGGGRRQILFQSLRRCLLAPSSITFTFFS
ncbi:hypothetical protein PVAP13_3NG103501 [Panicum virgatum]|uniref:Uncharacterized protein n=1 Tax=Panicum virgatum TaxID=38727 RepID=A0A8T0UGJ1_PANVG|nr:hypothetical protein PVAP13_3NG103501 [Panicum virgatum]